MNDLRTLLWSTVERDGAESSKSVPSPDSASLKALVGVTTQNVPSGSTRTIRELVGASSTASSSAVPDLSDLVGPPRASETATTADLTALVGARETSGRAGARLDLSKLIESSADLRGADEGWRAPDLAQAGRRPLFGGRRKAGAVNYMSVAVAALAVIALVGTASFAVVQRATANPADAAMISLREREAELANETKVLQTAVDLYAGSIADAASLAETSAPVLAGLQGRVDAAALASAESARLALLQKATPTAPVAVPVYARDQIDEQSFDQVGKAIDDVRLARETLPPLVAKARDARSTVVSALDEYRSALASVGTAIQAEAEKLVAENDSAGSSFRSAVTDAAARIVTAQRSGGDGLSDMPAYAAAVDALRAENARVVALEEAEREATPNRPSNPNGGTDSGGGSDSSEPGAPSPEPSQPAPSPDPEPSPEPTQPEPTPDPEPEPTEPSIPNPDPTAPIEGGTA
ncbi:hypothetical protein [Microbacterium sp. NPDC086615]|uniref:hypothetical protein n=1 Tax=Microbacterium sp. NPDC086615 TaxID=3154865 RepID=UPI003414E334